MIRKSQPQAASAKQPGDDEAKIEAAISRLTGVRSEMAGRMDEIIKKFDEFSDVFQVKVGELTKNPFQVEGVEPAVQEIAATEDPAAKAELIRRKKMEQQASTLRLLSIMRSENGSSCMINEQVMRPGEIVEGFIIDQIGSNFVELTWSEKAAGGNASETQDMKITLKLSE